MKRFDIPRSQYVMNASRRTRRISYSSLALSASQFFSKSTEDHPSLLSFAHLVPAIRLSSILSMASMASSVSRPFALTALTPSSGTHHYQVYQSQSSGVLPNEYINTKLSSICLSKTQQTRASAVDPLKGSDSKAKSSCDKRSSVEVVYHCTASGHCWTFIQKCAFGR